MRDKKCVIFSNKRESSYSTARKGDGRAGVGDERWMGINPFDDFDISDVELSGCSIT
jgi:hypothetical protein